MNLSQNPRTTIPLTIRKMSARDWDSVQKIYQQGIDTYTATFESQPPVSWDEWQEYRKSEHSLVCLSSANIVGWAAFSLVSSRCVYGGVAEISIYVATACQQRGVGSALLTQLIQLSETFNIWTLQAQIFIENEKSIALHEQHDFKRVGIRRKIGKMIYGPDQGQWKDNLLMERRSTVVGL